MRNLILLPLLFTLSSCSVLDTSFYDSNESMLAVEVRHEIEIMECGPKTYVFSVQESVNKLHLYSESKGSKDIYKLVSKMKETSDGLKEDMKPIFCSLKKKALQQQSKSIASAIMGRF